METDRPAETPGVGASMVDRRAVLEAARAALTGLAEVLWQEPSNELASLVELIDEVAARAAAAKVAVTVEATTRGVVASSQCAGVRGWVAAHAPSGAGGTAGQVARLVEAFTQPRAETREGMPLVRAAVTDTGLPVPVAVTVVDQLGRLAPWLMPGVEATVAEHMIEAGRRFGSSGVTRLRRGIIARFGAPGELDQLAERDRAHVCLTGGGLADGIATYQLTLDTAGRAVLEAALGPLSAPRPLLDEATGSVLEADTRTPGQRRGQALIELCRRAVATTTATPSGVKAMLYVTMPLEDLTRRTGAGATIGALRAGELLAPETVRQIACDAGIIPTILGTSSEPIDLGRARRLFTPGMTRHLWLRDHGCSFPGCDAPAHWCDAHHLWHWADGGPTTLDNAALLCARHHTIVHTHRLRGTLTPEGVTWDQAPGSYDRWLADRPREAPPHPTHPRGHTTHAGHAPTPGPPGHDTLEDDTHPAAPPDPARHPVHPPETAPPDPACRPVHPPGTPPPDPDTNTKDPPGPARPDNAPRRDPTQQPPEQLSA